MTHTSMSAVLSNSTPDWITRLRSMTWLAYLLAGAAVLLYLVQSIVYTHTLDSVLDEGAYLYKGYAFVTGQYDLYQDGGFWSNHMPLSFYIPGVVQQIFGAGIRTGRYFSVGVGLLMLLGFWLVTRRMGGPWWGAIVLLGIAINPAIVKMYSVAITQVMIACMLAWVLVLTLGGDRPRWQLVLGAILAGVMWMTRINLAPVLPILLVYIFWQYGRQAGIYASLAGGLTVLFLHAPFWPGILRMYAYWLPDQLTPFLEAWRRPNATPYWDPEVEFPTRVNSLFRTVRFHLLALLGVASTWIFWPRRSAWPSSARFRTAVFLSVLFLALWGLHFYATMGKNYCAFCLEGYSAFFASLGWVLLVLTFASWPPTASIWRQLIAVIFVLVTAVGIGYSTSELFGRQMLEIPLPFGLTSVGVVLQNKFGILPRSGIYLLPTLAGLAAGIAIVLAAGLLVLVYLRQPERARSLGLWAILLMFGAGLLLTPTRVLGGGYNTFDCTGNTIASYEAAGVHLASIIPSGSQVYWKGGLSVVPLLYVPGIRIYPSQVNGDYSLQLDGDPEDLVKYGYWNPELADRWLNEADYVLIEGRYYRDWFRDTVDQSRFEELEPTPRQAPCRDNSQIRIFRRLR
jgi:hypothetical protein